jgi:poly(3-hydroxybutyrate) depolymerase
MDRSKCKFERTVEIPGCKEVNPQDCHRSFTLALPSLICDDGSTRKRQEDGILDSGGHNHSQLLSVDSVGTLPLVFGIHCFGCSPSNLDVFLEHADARHAVLVMPHGLKRSFNARHCCGYALEHGVDDVGFLKYIITALSGEYSFIQSNISYATGWSNGGRSSHHFCLYELVPVYP